RGRREGRAGSVGVAAHENLAVRQACGGEAPRVRRLSRLDAVDDEHDARPGLDAGNQRTDAEAVVHPAAAASNVGVVATAHAGPSAGTAGPGGGARQESPRAASGSARSAGTGAGTSPRVPVDGCVKTIRCAWSARRWRP